MGIMAKKEMTGQESNELALINSLTGKNYKKIESARKYVKDHNLSDIQELLDNIEFNDKYEEYSYTDEEREAMSSEILYANHKYTLHSLELCNANLGQRIRYYRQIAGMTQKELANLCKLNESTIRNYELGNRFPDYDTLAVLATALEVSIFALTDKQRPNAPHSALKFLFDMEKYYLLKPVEIDGRMYLGFDYDIKSLDPNSLDDILSFTPAMMERLVMIWECFYNMFQSGEIDEDTYLLWQSKYPTFATPSPDDMFGTKTYNDVTIDQKIADAKKRVRKTKI
jgi:transcriptional regulator with XRE-family HTH domain